VKPRCRLYERSTDRFGARHTGRLELAQRGHSPKQEPRYTADHWYILLA
jgi:hypothetical protein